ncbi:MAG: hypothetical protein N3I35_11610 [Clostridia bacterium]|nr:hypothetical protein [Clostridia bacterium]
MGQIIAAVLIILFIIFAFVPLAHLNNNHVEIQSVKQDLNLAARAVCNSFKKSFENYESLSEGYEQTACTDIRLDKARLLREFYDILKKNCYNGIKFSQMKERICLKVLVYSDRFFIADRSDRWSPPFFFNIYKGQPINDIVALNTVTDDVSFYKNSEKIILPVTHPDVGIMPEEKEQIIINRLNEVISQNTYDEAKKRGLAIKIRNPDKSDMTYRLEYRYFNILEGITFFVLYAEDESVFIHNRSYEFKNYNVAGYTLKLKNRR